MREAFGQDPEKRLAQCLLRAIKAGLTVGGEFKQVKSAALPVMHEQPFPLAALRFLWVLYRPQVEPYSNARLIRTAYLIPKPEL